MEDKKRIRTRDDNYSYQGKTRRGPPIPEAPKPKIAKRKFDLSKIASSDFDICAAKNIILSTPSQELVRAHILLKCRDRYNSLVKHNISAFPPPESFNRLLFAMQTSEKEAVDPIIRDPDMTFTTDVLLDEIIPALPRFFKPRCTQLEVGLKVLDQVKQAVKDVLKDKCSDEILAQLFPKSPATPEEVVQEFNALKEKFPPLFRELLTEDLRNNVFIPLADFMKASLAELGRISEGISCNVKVSFNGDTVLVAPNATNCSLDNSVTSTLSLSKVYYDKLKEMHRLSGSESKFEDDLYCLLRRYNTIFGGNARSGTNFHSSLPESIFEFILRRCSTSTELFSSPLNNYFARYCSAFPDVDMPFGSIGSFYEVDIKSGSFQVCPPFTTQMMDTMAERVVALLDKTDKPLAFQIFVPEWRDPPSNYHDILDNTPYKQAVATFKRGEHYFVNGRQFSAEIVEDATADEYNSGVSRLWLCRHTTLVYLLANEAGLEAFYNNDALSVATSLENLMVGKDELPVSEEVCQF